MGVFVLVPAFNEATKLGDLLAAVPESIDGHPVSVLVVDDGSVDATADIARASGATVMQHAVNKGKGAALSLGMKEASLDAPDVLVWMDGDGQHLPESLPDLVRPVLKGEADLCVGSRYLEEGVGSRAPLNRRMVRKGTVSAVRKITGFAVTDPFSGYRSFSSRAMRVINLEGCGYECELESCFAVASAGMSYQEVPIPRIYGPDTSKMGHRHGAFRGRVDVLLGYARTVFRGWRDLHNSTNTPVNV